MDRPSASSHPRRLPIRPLLAAGALTLGLCGCGGGGAGGATTTTATIALALDRPGQAWPALSERDRRDAIKACRLEAAVAAGRGQGPSAAPFFSDRFRAIEQIGDDALGAALDRWSADGGHQRQTIQQGCSAVAPGLSDVAAIAERPHVSFALPVTSGHGPFTLEAATPTARLTGRVSPTGARASLQRPADRSRTTAAWTIRHRHDTVDIAMRHIPLGVSYVRVVVDGPTGRAGRLLVITRARRSRLGPARTFRPIELAGTGSRVLPAMLLPVPAVATVRTHGSAFALVASDTLLLAHPAGRTALSPIGPGAYRNVLVAAVGPWTLKIAPATR